MQIHATVLQGACFTWGCMSLYVPGVGSNCSYPNVKPTYLRVHACPLPTCCPKAVDLFSSVGFALAALLLGCVSGRPKAEGLHVILDPVSTALRMYLQNVTGGQRFRGACLTSATCEKHCRSISQIV